MHAEACLSLCLMWSCGFLLVEGLWCDTIAFVLWSVGKTCSSHVALSQRAGVVPMGQGCMTVVDGLNGEPLLSPSDFISQSHP